MKTDQKKRVLHQLSLVQVFAGCTWENEQEIIDWMKSEGIEVSQDEVITGDTWERGRWIQVTKQVRVVRLNIASAQTRFELSAVDEILRRVKKLPAYCFESN
jgi:hypothetical protein